MNPTTRNRPASNAGSPSGNNGQFRRLAGDNYETRIPHPPSTRQEIVTHCAGMIAELTTWMDILDVMEGRA